MKNHGISIYYLRLSLFLFFWLLTTTAFSFSLIEPKEHTTYFSGETFPVLVNTGDVAGVTAVRYFLYADYEDMLEELVDQKLVLTSLPTHTPPFGGIIRVPKSAIGTYRLLAVAQLEEGQIDTERWAVFDEILINIKPNSSLKEIDFECEKPLRFGSAASARVYEQVDFLGKTLTLPVIGRFSDGVVRSIRTRDSGTRYRVEDEHIVAVDQDGTLRLVGNGTTFLHVQNQDRHATLEIQVKVTAQDNQPPVSNPGKNQTVYSGEPVILNGLASYDPEGGSLQYHWSQIRGSKLSLLDPYSANARFLAPFVQEERRFRFKLVVTDIQGADSRPTYVDIFVTP